MKDIPVYLINLDTDKDRLEFMDDQLSDLCISYERFPAIRGTQLPDWLKPYFLDEDGNIASRLTAGEVGCYASHMAVMKIAADSDHSILVFEDDVRIKPEFPALLDEFLGAELTCDILRISSIRKKRKAFTKAKFSGGYKAVKYLRVPMNTGAYLITPLGARKFINWKTLRTAPVDHDLVRVWEVKLKTLGFSPEPVVHNVLDSTIDNLDFATSKDVKRGGERDLSWKPYGIGKIVEGAKRIAYACIA